MFIPTLHVSAWRDKKITLLCRPVTNKLGFEFAIDLTDRPRGQDESCLYSTCVIAVSMGLKGTTKLLVSTSKIKDRRGKVRKYERFLIHIPSSIAKDSQFPFKAGQELRITVDPKGKITLRA